LAGRGWATFNEIMPVKELFQPTMTSLDLKTGNLYKNGYLEFVIRRQAFGLVRDHCTTDSQLLGPLILNPCDQLLV